MNTIRVVGPSFRKPLEDEIVINTTSKAGWSNQLSPFLLGPVYLYHGIQSLTMENAWQYSKVYSEHVDFNTFPSYKWHIWSQQGWNNPKAIRYPMGKGRKPLYSYWLGDKLSYIEARKRIYIPLYANAVIQTEAFKAIKELYNNGNKLVLWDYDGYEHLKLNMNLTQVMENPNRPMGHAFVLAMLLENHPFVSNFLKE